MIPDGTTSLEMFKRGEIDYSGVETEAYMFLQGAEWEDNLLPTSHSFSTNYLWLDFAGDNTEFKTFVNNENFRKTQIGYSNYSYWKSTLRTFFKNKAVLLLVILIAAIIVMSFVYPIASPIDPNEVSLFPRTWNQRPSAWKKCMTCGETLVEAHRQHSIPVIAYHETSSCKLMDAAPRCSALICRFCVSLSHKKSVYV